MKQETATAKRYVPYGINGDFFVYDNESNWIPPGYGHKRGTKAAIQKLCDQMNKELQPQDTSTRKDELSGNICKHCGEPYTTKERNRVYGNNVLMSGYCSAGCYTEGTLNPAAPVKDELNFSYDGNENENYSFYLNGKDVGELHTDEDTAKAICTAVNSTYGKGLNPAVLEQLIEAAEWLLEGVDAGEGINGAKVMHAIAEFSTALTNAKTIKP